MATRTRIPSTSLCATSIARFSAASITCPHSATGKLKHSQLINSLLNNFYRYFLRIKNFGTKFVKGFNAQTIIIKYFLDDLRRTQKSELLSLIASVVLLISSCNISILFLTDRQYIYKHTHPHTHRQIPFPLAAWHRMHTQWEKEICLSSC